jgi:hypothetical protein
MSDLYTAMINGRSIELAVISDSFEKAIVIHEFPNRNGALTEDLGLNARSIEFVTYWIESSYEEHKLFLKELLSSDVNELVHPVYGLIKGRIRSARVQHDNTVDYCEIAISFVEDDVSLSQVEIIADVTADIEESFVVGQVAQIAEAEADYASASPFELRILEKAIASINAQADRLDAAANSLVASVDYPSSAPARLIQAAAYLVERTSAAITAIETTPMNKIDSIKAALTSLKDAFTGLIQKHIFISAAQAIAVAASDVFTSDEQKRQQLRLAEKNIPFDSTGRFSPSTVDLDVMTSNDLENSLAVVRQFMVDVYNDNRSMEFLKDMSASLLRYVSKIKIEAENIIDLEIKAPNPMHLICLMNGLHYNFADRIHSINEIVNPMYCSGKVRIYAR